MSEGIHPAPEAGAIGHAATTNVYPLRLHAVRPHARPLCGDCRLRQHCLPTGVPDAALQLLDPAAIGRRRVQAGQVLYAEGGVFRNIYAVYSGSFKSASTTIDGREQVTAFSHPGDLLGLSGLAGRSYTSSVTALEDSEVCAIAFDSVRDAAGASSEWRDALCRALGSRIVAEHLHALVLADASTEARVAFFLLQVSGWMRERGYSPAEFHLRMSRAEIGSYLGLTLETISRTLSAFQEAGLLSVRKRHIRILDLPALQRMRFVGKP